MYSQIVNPKTGIKVSVKSKQGRNIVNEYIRLLQMGGASVGAEDGVFYGVSMTHLAIPHDCPTDIAERLNEDGGNGELPDDQLISIWKMDDGKRYSADDWFFTIPDNMTIFFATPVGMCSLAGWTEEHILGQIGIGMDGLRGVTDAALSKFLYHQYNDILYNLSRHHSDLDTLISKMGEYSTGDKFMNMKVNFDDEVHKWNIFMKKAGGDMTMLFDDQGLEGGASIGYCNLANDVCWGIGDQALAANKSYLLEDILTYIRSKFEGPIEIWIQGCNPTSHHEVWMGAIERQVGVPGNEISDIASSYILKLSREITNAWKSRMSHAHEVFDYSARQQTGPVTRGIAKAAGALPIPVENKVFLDQDAATDKALRMQRRIGRYDSKVSTHSRGAHPPEGGGGWCSIM